LLIVTLKMRPQADLSTLEGTRDFLQFLGGCVNSAHSYFEGEHYARTRHTELQMGHFRGRQKGPIACKMTDFQIDFEMAI